jgi:hypothetical protein
MGVTCSGLRRLGRPGAVHDGRFVRPYSSFATNEARNSAALFKFVRDVANSPTGDLVGVPSHAGIDPIRWGNN